ncbi:MAG: ABC transporter permease [Oscillospiraceae bacterium]|nr:ABC transporter permease [Oscillospiraceae bacterium]
MLTYFVKRLTMTLAVLLVVVVFLSLMIHIVPGDPAKTLLGPRASPEMIERVRSAMDLDQPVHIQIGRFALNLLRGNLGTDIFTGRSINDMIGDALPHTITLALAGLGLAIILGIPLGVYSATHPGSWPDRLTTLFSISLITIPAYVAGLFLLLIFAVQLRILPAIGAGTSGGVVEYLKSLFLPSVSLAISWIGYMSRLVRTSLLEVLNENYIRAARAGGVSERLIRYKYALKNALIPTVAVLGVGIGSLMGGAVFIEVIFSRPGMGLLLYKAIESRNFPVVRAGVLIVSFLFVVINFLVDFIYTLLDPRIQLDKVRD